MPSEKPQRRWRDIVEQIDLVRAFVDGMQPAGFVADIKTRFAVERALLIIAEAATKLGAEAERAHPDVPWHEIRGLGNRIRHAYDQISPLVLWRTVALDLDALRAAASSHLTDPDP